MGRDIIAYMDDKKVDLERDQELFDYLGEIANNSRKKNMPESVRFSFELDEGSEGTLYWINISDLKKRLDSCQPLLGANWRKLIKSSGDTLYFWFGS